MISKYIPHQGSEQAAAAAAIARPYCSTDFAVGTSLFTTMEDMSSRASTLGPITFFH